MEAVKCELFLSEGPAAYFLVNWNFRALFMYLFQVPPSPWLIGFQETLFQNKIKNIWSEHLLPELFFQCYFGICNTKRPYQLQFQVNPGLLVTVIR